ncbi:MAG: hypothetical protein ABGY43_21160 [bacterium]
MIKPIRTNAEIQFIEYAAPFNYCAGVSDLLQEETVNLFTVSDL